MSLIPKISFQTVSAEREQDWNREVLATPVTSPMIGIWRYSGTAVVQGCSQSFPDPGLAGVPLVKRAAGGGAVLVGPWMLSFSIALPSNHPLVAGGLVESYRWLGELIVNELDRIGICAHAVHPAELHERNRKNELRWACFGGLSPWEVTVGDRKIAGLAQRRTRNGVLFAAGILVEPSPWEILCDVLGQDTAATAYLSANTVSCAEVIGRPVSSFDLGVMIDRALVKKLFCMAVPDQSSVSNSRQKPGQFEFIAAM